MQSLSSETIGSIITILVLSIPYSQIEIHSYYRTCDIISSSRHIIVHYFNLSLLRVIIFWYSNPQINIDTCDCIICVK